jgi:MazG family protein
LKDTRELVEIMARLRDPEHGCPWDMRQDFHSIAPYTIEEAFEVADAIERGDLADLQDELGDLLFQVVFHARMAEEAGAFAYHDVVAAVCDKMTRRHPHVFADATVADAEAQTLAWEAHKAQERAARGPAADASALANVPRGLPALVRAQKLGRRASKVGFDWPDAAGAVEKLDEELAEIRAALDADHPDDQSRRNALSEELGDLLFAVVNVCRHVGVDAEGALRGANGKFERRFRAIEARLAEDGRGPVDSSLAEMDRLWDEVKGDGSVR